MARIVVSSRLPGRALEMLAARHTVELLGDSAPVSPIRLYAALEEADALLSMLTDPITRQALLAARRLLVIGNCAVGFDNIDVASASELGIQVTHTPDVLTDATADLAFALLLAAARRIGEGDRCVRAGHFAGFRIDLLLGRQVFGQTLGIVGLGRIGSAVARRARGFSMRILYTQRTRLAPERERELALQFVDKTELFEKSDFVSLHLPMSRETEHYVDRATLAAMKPTAVLVNTARGRLIDEAALAEALRDKRLAAAGLDVFEHEPILHPALLECDNAVLTPHIGSATEETRAQMAEAVATDILGVLDGQPPLHPVNRPAHPRRPG